MQKKKNKKFNKELNKNDTINHVNESLNITIKYGVFGVLWIILSDRLLMVFIKDYEAYMNFQTAKGWIYVIITMILIYILIQNRMKIIKKTNNNIFTAYESLKKQNDEIIILDTELKYQKNLNQNIIDVAPVIICVWDQDCIIKSINPFGEVLFGYQQNEIIGSNWLSILADEENRIKAKKIVEEIKQKGKGQNFECQFVNKKGEYIDILWNTGKLEKSKDKNDEFVSIGIDITEEKKYQESIEHMAFFDKLTGLPNRTRLEIEVNKYISKSKEERFAIVYIDIDNFKYINDTLGHQVGDIFLKYVGDILDKAIKTPNYLARVSGDEFAVILEMSNKEETLQEIENIKSNIAKRWIYNNYQFFISMSAGIVFFPENGDDINKLLKNAEITMYAAKRQGKNMTLLYNNDLHENNEQHINMANKIQLGIDNEEFTLYYQPQYELNTKIITGVETLIRWNHENEGFISPAEFIPVAEETGQIYGLELWIFEKALKQKREWEKEGLEEIEVSINLSAKTLISEENFDKLELLIASIKVDYTKICIEITETAIISNLGLVIKRLIRLKQKGLRIALDDFGTGFSSLTYLKELPIDIIKLDQSFIKLLLFNEKDSVIVRSILLLAHDLEFSVVAEGIETEEQMDYLKRFYCETGQGYLLNKPMPPEEIEKILNKQVKKI